MEDRCVSCGAIIPEGRQVCKNCERKSIEDMLQYGNFYKQKKRIKNTEGDVNAKNK